MQFKKSAKKCQDVFAKITGAFSVALITSAFFCSSDEKAAFSVAVVKKVAFFVAVVKKYFFL